MTLIELKNFISNGIVPSDFLIFIRKDNSFLVHQYVTALGKLAAGGLTKITSIYTPQQSSLAILTAPSGTLNILTVETFNERAEDYTQFENTIVICDQIDKSIAKNVADYVVNFPKLEEWQILDYAKTICPGLDDEDLSWLIKATDNNIERVLNELDKVALFDEVDQKAIFNSIRFDPQTDLYSIDLFTIVNALVEGNSRILYDFLNRNDYESLEPVVLANRALTSIKNIILVTQNSTLTAADCGISVSQYRFIQYTYRSLNVNAAKEKLKFLVNFDLALKTSKLDLSKRDLLNYLISHLNYKITL